MEKKQTKLMPFDKKICEVESALKVWLLDILFGFIDF